MQRSILLVIAAAAFATACSPAPRPRPAAVPARATTASVDREQTADQQIAHALNRLTFGARPGDAEQIRGTGLDQWIEQQLRPERIDDSALNRFLSANYLTLELKPAALEQKWPPPGQLLNQAAARGGATRADSARLRDSNQGLRQITTEVQSARVARRAERTAVAGSHDRLLAQSFQRV